MCPSLYCDIASSLVPPSNRTCPLHYDLLGDDCYFVSYVKLSWQEAREACQRESGGDLISVHSPFEQGRKQLELSHHSLSLPFILNEMCEVLPQPAVYLQWLKSPKLIYCLKVSQFEEIRPDLTHFLPYFY